MPPFGHRDRPFHLIVDRGSDSPRIVVYMNAQDVVSVLRELGVLPPMAAS